MRALHRDAHALSRTRTQKCGTPVLSGVVRLAAENIMMASERASEAASVRSFVRSAALETGDKEGVSTAAIMIALSASPTPLHRALHCDGNVRRA